MMSDNRPDLLQEIKSLTEELKKVDGRAKQAEKGKIVTSFFCEIGHWIRTQFVWSIVSKNRPKI